MTGHKQNFAICAKTFYSILSFAVLLWISVLCILEFLSTVISVYLHNELLEGDKERVALTCATKYLHILSLTACFKYLDHLRESNSINTRTWLVWGSNSNDTETEQSPGQLYTIVYMLGAVGLICVNSISLIAELILKTRNGERTLTDLRVILLPSECVFAICCLALAISAFWRKEKERLKNHINYWRHLCRRTQTSRDPPVENHELENPAVPASQQRS
ncbi:uncharacterized protein LOC118242397 [Electrophorus electricus]|uniref:uncharacterized protein LOC118242397 n=1 Tax=Electrophorus electricus TaxID=8005 RepID=UPI0015CFDDDA|nr:uncharacterized protein LOC118242397 [Electrophorus electricus]